MLVGSKVVEEAVCDSVHDSWKEFGGNRFRLLVFGHLLQACLITGLTVELVALFVVLVSLVVGVYVVSELVSVAWRTRTKSRRPDR